MHRVSSGPFIGTTTNVTTATITTAAISSAIKDERVLVNASSSESDFDNRYGESEGEIDEGESAALPDLSPAIPPGLEGAMRHREAVRALSAAAPPPEGRQHKAAAFLERAATEPGGSADGTAVKEMAPLRPRGSEPGGGGALIGFNIAVTAAARRSALMSHNAGKNPPPPPPLPRAGRTAADTDEVSLGPEEDFKGSAPLQGGPRRGSTRSSEAVRHPASSEGTLHESEAAAPLPATEEVHRVDAFAPSSVGTGLGGAVGDPSDASAEDRPEEDAVVCGGTALQFFRPKACVEADGASSVSGTGAIRFGLE